jgi:hypothetical protein
MMFCVNISDPGLNDIRSELGDLIGSGGMQRMSQASGTLPSPFSCSSNTTDSNTLTRFVA